MMGDLSLMVCERTIEVDKTVDTVSSNGIEYLLHDYVHLDYDCMCCIRQNPCCQARPINDKFIIVDA
jgi:hypothetical protein